MLIIGRKRDQKIVIADNIEITILEIGRNRVRFGIEAPKEVPIHTRLQERPAESHVRVVTVPVPEEESQRQVAAFHAVVGGRPEPRRRPAPKAPARKSLKPL